MSSMGGEAQLVQLDAAYQRMQEGLQKASTALASERRELHSQRRTLDEAREKTVTLLMSAAAVLPPDKYGFGN